MFQAFEGFIGKYATFLKFGNYTWKDRDLHALVAMITPPGQPIPKNGTSTHVQMIVKSLQGYDFEDIVSELNILFMVACQKFKKRADGPHFAGFLYGYFKFQVRTWLRTKLRDAMNHMDNLEFATEALEEELPIMQLIEDSKEFEHLFGEAGQALDQVERWILHLYYDRNMTDKEVAKLMGVTRLRVRDMRQAARRKLEAIGASWVGEKQPTEE